MASKGKFFTFFYRNCTVCQICDFKELWKHCNSFCTCHDLGFRIFICKFFDASGMIRFQMRANIADRVAVMYAGDIVEIGTADEIYYDPRHPYTWALLSSMPQMGVKGEDLFNIQGTPPNLFTEIHGDAFAPRNPLALKIDFVKRPPYFDVSTTHRAKTWLLDPRAPKIEPPAAVRMLQEEGK